jgi:Domain of unknown function (DUF6475)
MNVNQKADFYALIADVLGYWKQDVSEFALNVWWNGCQSFELSQISQALSNHATDPDKGQFAPKVADIVRILGGTKTDRSLREWGRVHEAMSRVGAYQDIDFGDGATHAAIRDMGGWPKMCRTEMDQLSYLQHRFCELYKVHDGQSDGVPALMGDRSPDEMFRKKGISPQKPILISGGNPTKSSGFQSLESQIVDALGWKK